MIVSYDGKNYNGFQKQKNGNSIQEELEKAIKVLTKQDVTCVGSGRTDAKVSAYFQPVHFEIEKPLNAEKFLISINGILPSDIKVLKIEETKIHARFSAKRKTYCYKMYVSDIEKPLLNDALQIKPTLNSKKEQFDFKNVKKFCKAVVGKHDFASFRASGGINESTIRTIYSCKLKKEGDHLNFYITGNGFLYKMVRNIVGTMLEIGKRNLNLKELKKSMFTTYKCTKTAKPEFLYLFNVNYN